MRRLLFLFFIALVAVLSLPVAGSAQQADDLIRLAAQKISSGDLSVFDSSTQSWLRKNRDQASRLKQAGELGRIVQSDDQVTADTWYAAGRAIHKKGASDWNLTFDTKSRKIKIVDLTVRLIGEPLPEAPDVALPGPPSGLAHYRYGSSGRYHGYHGHAPTAPTANLSPADLKPCASYPVLCGGENSGEADRRVVEFLYATTRQQAGSDDHIDFSGERSGALTFGSARVQIPKDHRLGKIELPKSGLLDVFWERKPDPEKHFIIQDVKKLSEDGWRELVASSRKNEALVFVHGYNVSFNDALYRTAQVVWDLQYAGLPVLFSWASRGALLDYEYDRESAFIARASFIELIRTLEAQPNIERVHVLAHSMGNQVVLDALNNEVKTSDPVKIAELMMAAPDVDRDYFTAAAPLIRKIAGGMTLYASSADRALQASRRIAGGVPRAGDVPSDGPVIVPGVESIDVTRVGDDILGLNHDVFAGTRSVMDDIGVLLNGNPRLLPNRRLIEIRGVPEGVTPPKYWRYTP